MHEHGLADHIVDRILDHPDRPPHTSPTAVTVVASELAGLSEDALQAALDHACQHQGLDPIQLILEVTGLLGECRACGAVAQVDEHLICSACGAEDMRLCAGEIILIKSCQFA
jgi:Zn finger protein HypA/HybF involved in hydrogenase expression